MANTLVSSVVNFTIWFAIIFYVFLQTKSVFATGIISGVYLILTASLGIWFGSLVDNYKKKRVMLASSVVSLVFYILSFLVYQYSPAGAFTDPFNVYLWVLVLLLTIGVIVGNIRGIALPTLVSILVAEDGRDKANGLAGTASGISFLITSVISGLLVGHSGMFGVLVLAMTATAGVIVHLWLMPIPEKGIVHADGQTKRVDLKGTMKVVSKIPGLFPLILFTTINNLLGGVYMALMDAYGLSMVSVQVWGLLWGLLSTGFIVGGLIIAKKGLGKNPLRSLFMANLVIWSVSAVFTLYPSIIILSVGMFIYLVVVPFIEASEHTIIQKVVPQDRLGRVFGFSQSVEQAASPLTAFLIGPLTQFFFIPFMTTGAGARLIGGWFGTGADRGIALVFTMTGLLGLGLTIIAMNSRFSHQLTKRYLGE